MEFKKTFEVEILRPDGAIRYRACAVAFPAHDGEREVLAGHVPFLSVVEAGILRVCKENGEWDYFFVDGGTVEVEKGHFCLLTSRSVPASKIVREEAQTLLSSAQKRKTGEGYSPEQKREDVRMAQCMVKLAGLEAHRHPEKGPSEKRHLREKSEI